MFYSSLHTDVGGWHSRGQRGWLALFIESFQQEAVFEIIFNIKVMPCQTGVRVMWNRVYIDALGQCHGWDMPRLWGKEVVSILILLSVAQWIIIFRVAEFCSVVHGNHNPGQTSLGWQNNTALKGLVSASNSLEKLKKNLNSGVFEPPWGPYCCMVNYSPRSHHCSNGHC